MHCVRAHGACLDDLRACAPPPPAVALHSFSGAAELARNYARQVAAPVYFGFSASLSLQSSSFGEAVRAVAADRLLLESDAADADDAAAGCAAVLAALADARGWSLAEAAERTRRNAHEFWRRWAAALRADGGDGGAHDAAEVRLTDLPAELLAHVLVRLLLGHDIARVAPACRAFRDAVRLAFVERPHSGEVVTLDAAAHGHIANLLAVAATSDGHIITGGYDQTIKVWSGARWEHSIFANWERDSTGRNAVHGGPVLALWPMSDGFLSGSVDGPVKLWTLDGALERTFQAGGEVLCAAVLPDGDHFVVGVSVGEAMNAILLYHFDRTLVHAFRAGEDEAAASMLAVTPDGQHIISDSHITSEGSYVEGFYVEGEAVDFSVKVWSVASKSLVATCRHTASVTALAAMPDGMRFLSFAHGSEIRVWLLNGTLENTFSVLHHLSWTPGARPRGAARQPARALRLARQDRQALQRQRWRRPAHLQAPHRPGGVPGAAARRPPLRQRLRQDRPRRRARARPTRRPEL